MESAHISPIPEIRIKQKGVCTEITIDGQALRGVRGFSISQKGGQQPTLSLDLLACNMTIDCACIPALPEVFEGWYKPAWENGEEAASVPMCID